MLSKALVALLLFTLPVAAGISKDKLKEFDRHTEAVTFVLHSNGGLCAATVIDKARGLLLTAAHCLRPHPLTGAPSKAVTIEGVGQETVRASVLKVDEDSDLAVVDADVTFKDEAQILSSFKEVYRYQDVYTLGHPLGWVYTGHAGVISYPHRNDGNVSVDQIQIDMTINHGNSGGGLFDEDGTLIGVLSWGLTLSREDNAPMAGMNFAISYRTINDFLKGV